MRSHLVIYMIVLLLLRLETHDKLIFWSSAVRSLQCNTWNSCMGNGRYRWYSYPLPVILKFVWTDFVDDPINQDIQLSEVKDAIERLRDTAAIPDRIHSEERIKRRGDNSKIDEFKPLQANFFRHITQHQSTLLWSPFRNFKIILCRRQSIIIFSPVGSPTLTRISFDLLSLI